MRDSSFLRVFLIVAALAAGAYGAAAQKTGRDRVLKVDAVELIDRGREVEGIVDHQVQHGRYTYLFSSDANLKVFNADPTRYEIQLNGACGRMGPLSGEGSPKLFAVHDGRLYIFASEQCRRSFVAAPEKMLERYDPKPQTTEESIERGRVLLARAVKAHGGADRIDAVSSYREGLSHQTESGGKTYIVTDTVTFLFPDGVRSENCWNDQCWAYTVRRGEGWTTDSSGDTEPMIIEPMIIEQVKAVWRSAGRHPLMLLRARNQADAIVTSEGDRRTVSPAGEKPCEVELLTMHLNGMLTTLGIDSAGRVRLLSYEGRGPTLGIGKIERVYSRFADIGGISLATHVETLFEGKPSPESSGDFAVQAVNEPTDADAFKKPPSK